MDWIFNFALCILDARQIDALAGHTVDIEYSRRPAIRPCRHHLPHRANQHILPAPAAITKMSIYRFQGSDFDVELQFAGFKNSTAVIHRQRLTGNHLVTVTPNLLPAIGI